MKRRLIAISLAALAAGFVLAATAGAAMIGIYRSDMETEGQRAQIGKLSGERCGRGGSDQAFRMVVGKRTRECAYRTPVVGRDLEIAAVARLLRGTPKQVRRKAFLALNLRTGRAGAGYQLRVFPLQRKVQLLKVLSDGGVKYLHIEKGVKSVRGTDRGNVLRLRAFNVTKGPEKGTCRIVALVGKQRVAAVTDDAAGLLQGRSSGFSAGALPNGKGVVASVDNVVVRVPSPFG